MTEFSIRGDKLYQKRARSALPILVRQAEARQPIYYRDLADELGMSNPHNLNYPLGAIGEALLELGKSWRQIIPPLQCLVINKATGLPGVGVSWAVPGLSGYASMSRGRRQALVDKELADIYVFDRWLDVLKAFGLAPMTASLSEPELSLARTRGGPAESDVHRLLKQYVANNPAILGLSSVATQAEVEYSFPSGDVVDILFRSRSEWIAVEVKAANADIAEITRGVFQCVKYGALLKAVLMVQKHQADARAVLITEGAFPPQLIPVRNTLGVEVIDKIAPS
jgi:hypothetical protein